MANDFYTESGKPFQASQGLSTAIRDEFKLIRQGFDKLPDVTGNAGKIVQIDPLGSGNLVPANSLVTGLDADKLDGQHGSYYAVATDLTTHTADATKHLTSTQNTWIDAVTATSTEVNYLSGASSNIQTQINTKLASSSYTAADVLTKVKTVDGSGSGLDADTLDGQEGAYYAKASDYTAADVLTKIKTVDGTGSGLDADTLDGQEGTYYAVAANVEPSMTAWGASFPNSLATNYTNSTGQTIDVAIVLTMPAGATVTATVDSYPLQTIKNTGASSCDMSLYFRVPKTRVYRLDSTGAPTIVRWHETY